LAALRVAHLIACSDYSGGKGQSTDRSRRLTRIEVYRFLVLSPGKTVRSDSLMSASGKLVLISAGRLGADCTEPRIGCSAAPKAS